LALNSSDSAALSLRSPKREIHPSLYRKLAGRSRPSRKALVVGRLSLEKGLHTLMEAWR
jgi:glycosyltransferase involved in cell wall biosynthesis